MAASQLGDAEQQIAQLMLDVGIAVTGFGVQKFQPFGFDPGEAVAGRLGVDAVGSGKRIEIAGQGSEDAGGLAFLLVFFLLEFFPGLELIAERGEFFVAENVGMPVHHLRGVALEHVVEGEGAFLFEVAGYGDDEEGHVAEFLADVVSVAVADGADEFVAFFDDVFAEAFGRLHSVPGAAVRSDEALDDIFKSGDAFVGIHWIVLRLDVEPFHYIRRQGCTYLIDNGVEIGAYARVFVEIRVGAEFVEQNENNGKDDDALGQAQ